MFKVKTTTFVYFNEEWNIEPTADKKTDEEDYITSFVEKPSSDALPGWEAEVDEEIDLIRESSSDRYEMLKSIYYQNRNSQIEEDYVQNLPTPKIYIE